MICSQERRRENEESNSELLFQENNVQEGDEEEEDYDDDERLDSGALRHLSMLHLNSAAAAAKHRPTPEKCTACGSSMKRPSPSLQEPSPKRLTLLPPASPSLLYRSRSEPIDFLGLLQTTAENSSKIPSAPLSPAKISDSRPPPIPPLRRSLSDPTAALEFQPPPPPQPPVVPPPPRASPVAAQTIKSPPQESPNTKRLKRMKDRLRQMKQWWGQVLEEEDEEDSNAAQDNNSKEGEEEKGEEAKTSSSAAEESVWVDEKGGDGLVIHFKCPCKKGYEILLSGNNCYYKLM